MKLNARSRRQRHWITAKAPYDAIRYWTLYLRYWRMHTQWLTKMYEPFAQSLLNDFFLETANSPEAVAALQRNCGMDQKGI